VLEGELAAWRGKLADGGEQPFGFGAGQVQPFGFGAGQVDQQPLGQPSRGAGAVESPPR